MFDYKEFKKEMENRGHEVHKKGNKIIIKPDNNYNGYSKGFRYGTDIIEGYEDDLEFVDMDHYNTTIYEAIFKII